MSDKIKKITLIVVIIFFVFILFLYRTERKADISETIIWPGNYYSLKEKNPKVDVVINLKIVNKNFRNIYDFEISDLDYLPALKQLQLGLIITPNKLFFNNQIDKAVVSLILVDNKGNKWQGGYVSSPGRI